LVLLDPNCRPGAVTDHQAYRRRLTAIARRADIVKASTEDLAYLYQDASPEQAARLLLAGGSSLVIVTDGPRPARAFLPGATLEAPVPAVPVADTIGAGDAFGGSFLAWWLAHGYTATSLKTVTPKTTQTPKTTKTPETAKTPGMPETPGTPEAVAAALAVAVAAAALTCGRPGADPPTREQLRAWWPAT
jgi:fructokinase